MGKAGRFACVFVPMALTIASLVCLVLVFLGNREPNNGTTLQFYFFRADATNFTSSPAVDVLKNTNVDNALAQALLGQLQAGNISDVYQVGLWDYCQGDRTPTSTSSSINFTHCSSPEANYFFNLTEAWGISSSAGADNAIPKTLADAQKVYKTVAHWMFIAYVVALSCTAAEILVGFLAIFSRWGSCLTTLVSAASTLFTLGAAITSTALTSIIVGALNTVLEPYGVKSTFGTQMLTVVWLAVAFSLAAGLFWTFSTCCCSGRSGYKRDGGMRRQGTLVEQARYTHEYKPLAEPFGSQAYAHHGQQREGGYGAPDGSVPMQNFGGQQPQQQQQYGVLPHGHPYQQPAPVPAPGGAYEPFRSV